MYFAKFRWKYDFRFQSMVFRWTNSGALKWKCYSQEKGPGIYTIQKGIESQKYILNTPTIVVISYSLITREL